MITYICVFVFDDGDNELSKQVLTEEQVRRKLFDGYLSYSEKQVESGDLGRALIDYGNEPDDVKEAIDHILAAQPGETCIVGKV